MVGAWGSEARPDEAEENTLSWNTEQMGFNTQEALMAY